MIKIRSIEFGQAKRCAMMSSPLQKRERRCDVSDGQLHRFALLQPLQKFSHFTLGLYFSSNSLKRASARIASHAGSICKLGKETVSPPAEDIN